MYEKFTSSPFEKHFYAQAIAHPHLIYYAVSQRTVSVTHGRKKQAQARLPNGAADVGVSVMMCKMLGGEDANRLFSRRNTIYQTKY